MKVIIIYSGKGGVGKTTITANIAKILIEQKQKVFILDADVNTPSMPVIFPEPNPNKYLMVDSLGYKNKSTIYITQSAIRSYLTEAINAMNSFNPDYVLIDTPPSITDVHINLLDKIKPSGLIIVTQPNALSISDINRTSMFFKEKGVNIIGIVENMCTDNNQQKYNYEVLESIPFENGFSNENAFKNNKEKYSKIVLSIADSEAVILKNQRRLLFDEEITEEDINFLRFKSKNDLQFVNLKTWDYVKDLLFESESGMAGYDRALDELTTERIGRMLKAFEFDEQAYFMITKAPSCVIQLLPGEIGQASLTVSKSYYGVPRIKYQTSQGEVTLFPYEIMPVSGKDLLKWLSEGYLPTKDGRYIPPISSLEEIEDCFGSRVGLSKNWRELYEQIVNGTLPPIDESPQPESLTLNKAKQRKYRREKTIGDFAFDVKIKGRL